MADQNQNPLTPEEFEDKIEDIVNDPNKDFGDVIEEVGEALREQADLRFNDLPDLDLDLEDDFDTSSSGADTATPVDNDASAPTLEDVEKEIDDLYEWSQKDKSPADTAAPADTADVTAEPDRAPTADVTGDPETATYGYPTESSTEPTVTPAAAGDTSEPTATPAAGGTEPENMTGTTGPDLNAATGVEGDIDYFSPRDVDGDGNIDLAHSRVDGIDTITHYGDDGSITLVEQDLDDNGTYETAAAAREDGTLRIVSDLDDDGAPDQAAFYDQTSGAAVRTDHLVDGQITDTQLDYDGNGIQEVHLVDTDGDGRFDTAIVDTDADGIVNSTFVDTDGDGDFDLKTDDTDNDGAPDTFTTANMTGPDVLGSIETFEEMIPADDMYHAQAQTEDYSYPPVAEEVPSDLA
ncbi:hypothetical protein [Rhodococcus spongiicola]|uniref:hypothetical protein n=1 Tax=Rhodococcus spongiicola TaxID=2487352 RepID=UPI0013E33BA4|nr:hypothetical protein [Rhodococcus spongiicola]